MADEAARIAQLESELASSRQRETALTARNTALTTELSEALEQQTATAEVLRVIASSPTDLQRVVDTIVESAANLCQATNGGVWRVIGNTLQRVAVHGARISPGFLELPIGRGSVVGRAVVDQQTQHVLDLKVVRDDFPDSAARMSHLPRTMLATPLLQDGAAVGAITIYRAEVRSFTEQQIQLLETFADQAVIAIENARLFSELEQRNTQLQASNRQVTEALAQQTATAEMLRVIASSPTDVQPVLDAVATQAPCA